MEDILDASLYAYLVAGDDYILMVSVLRSESDHLSLPVEPLDRYFVPAAQKRHRSYVDEFGLLQITIFEDVYERYGHVVHREGALLVEGRVEQDARRGFSFLAERITSLRRILSAHHPGSSVAPSDPASATG